MYNEMFCYQCQETAGGSGCTKIGACGKTSEVAMLQDALVYATKGLSCVTTRLREEKKRVSKEIDHLVTQNLFVTVTNTNFDKEDLTKRIAKTASVKKTLMKKVTDASDLPIAAFWSPSDGLGKGIPGFGVLAEEDIDKRSLKELITYGLKGLAAYMTHANALFTEDRKIDVFIQNALAKTLDEEMDIEDLVFLALETGQFGFSGMMLLDNANGVYYGAPEITPVRFSTANKPGILVSGHDFRDLEMLLTQSIGAGVDVYTHGEMLPAHYRPKFKRFPHLIGNYGGAWWEQRDDFESFNGPVLMTTNCVMPPRKTYIDRLWTTGAASVNGCKHIQANRGGKKDFQQIIRQAKSCSPPTLLETGGFTGGFGHKQFTYIFDSISNALRSGDVKKFVVMAGCDGRMKSRNYYTEFAKSIPKDTIILTAGCAKYRFMKLGLGDIHGLPRVIDAGQCNDVYSLVLLALMLQDELSAQELYELPIVFNISWYEQKAVIVLLALLSLGFENIHLGPTLPAFISPYVANLLDCDFGLSGITTVENDLLMMFDD